MNVVFPLASFHTGYGLSADGKERVRETVRILASDSNCQAVLSGGELAYGTDGLHHEVVMAELAQRGVGPERILDVFGTTRHTVDEALAVAALVDSVDVEKLYIVTSFVHYPRAPFIFRHFLDFSSTVFVLVADKSARDVTLFNHVHEAEAYQEDRRRGGLHLANGDFVKTDFTYEEFTRTLGDVVDIRIPGYRDHEFPETREMNLFEHYKPNSPFEE